MPHAQYLDPFLLCPWPGCGHHIGLVDFRVEALEDPPLYVRVMASWGWQAEYGLLARCPGCRQHVLFTPSSKRAVPDPSKIVGDMLPDDWHQHAIFV